jgi:hypothetical protein
MTLLAEMPNNALWLYFIQGNAPVHSMSPLIVRRTGSLHDPEVRLAGATFRDLRGTHTGRIEKMRAVSKLDS